MGALASRSKPTRDSSAKEEGSPPPPLPSPLSPACRVTTWPKTGLVRRDFWPRAVAYDEQNDAVLVAAGLGRAQRLAGILVHRRPQQSDDGSECGFEPRELWWIAGAVVAAVVPADMEQLEVSLLGLTAASPVRGFALLPRSAAARLLGARALLHTNEFGSDAPDQLWLANPVTAQTFALVSARHSGRIVAVACDSCGRVATLAVDYRRTESRDASGRRPRDASLRAMGDMRSGGGSATIRLLTVATRVAFRTGGGNSSGSGNDDDRESSHTLAVVADHELPPPPPPVSPAFSSALRPASSSSSSVRSSSGWELPCAVAFGADDRMYVLDCSPYVGGRALLFRSSPIETDGDDGRDGGGGDQKFARCTWTAIADFTAAFARAEMSPATDGVFLALDEFRGRAYVAHATHVHAARFGACDYSGDKRGGAALPVGALFAGDRKRRGRAADDTRGRRLAARFACIAGCAIRTRPIDAARDVAPRVAAIRSAITANVCMQTGGDGGGGGRSSLHESQPWPPGIAELVEQYARSAALPAESLVVSDLDNRCVREIPLS